MNTEHLGGHLGITHLDPGLLHWMMRAFRVSSMIDVGCGPGGMVELATQRGLEVLGVDGDPDILFFPLLLRWDYTKGPAPITRDFDWGYSCEFLEHVSPEFLDNYMQTFARCSYVTVTAAPPGKPGHHHVNCQDETYWKGVFSRYGLRLDILYTREMRKHSTMKREFVRETGMFFVNDQRRTK